MKKNLLADWPEAQKQLDDINGQIDMIGQNMVYADKMRVKNDGILKIGMPGKVNF